LDAVVRQVIPEVPKSARNTIQGKIQVKVRVDVDPSGKVKSARLVSPGPSKYFAGLALKAAQQWEFSPPEGPDQNHSRSWILRFLFGRASTQVIPIREHV
jgi:TonB family protein